MTLHDQTPRPVRHRPPGAVRFVTVAEAAATMRVSKMTVYRLCQGEDPELPSVRVGRSIRIPYDAFAYYMDKGSSPEPGSVSTTGQAATR